MSGIYIENAKLPGQGDDLIIFDNGSVWTTMRPTNGLFRIDGAKAVEVPDHGDLIDRNVLIEKRWDADTRCGYVQVIDVGDVVDAPTIIPADK